jgi:hypothetical protein
MKYEKPTLVRIAAVQAVQHSAAGKANPTVAEGPIMGTANAYEADE